MPTIPALLYGLFAIAGCSFILMDEKWPSFLLLAALFYLGKERRTLGLAIAFLTAFGTDLRTELPYETKNLKHAHFHITSIEKKNERFKESWIYRGTVEKTPALLILKDKKGIKRPKANRDYLIDGTLKKGTNGHYFFTPDRRRGWIPIKNSWSVAEMRFEIKERVRLLIEKKYRKKRVRELMCGLVTGNFDALYLKENFARFGLQHLLCISGFHFSLLAALLGGFLRRLFRGIWGDVTLLFGMSGYFLFLGPSASVIRAFTAILLSCFGQIVGRESRPLHSLGIALLLIAFFYPTMITQLGFIFSFVITASILITYPMINRSFSHWIKERSFENVSAMPRVDQTCYCFLILFKQATALACSVNLAALPLTLYTIGQFPLLSLFYNLFYPALMTLSITLFLLGCVTNQGWIHQINEWYTDYILGLTENLPMSLDIIIG